MALTTSINMDSLITVKVAIQGEYRRVQLPLRELGPSMLPSKLSSLLALPVGTEVVYERYSDSAAAYVILDPNNLAVYKQLYRAAKAKLKLRLRATIVAYPEPAPARESVGTQTAKEAKLATVTAVDPAAPATAVPPTPAPLPAINIKEVSILPAADPPTASEAPSRAVSGPAPAADRVEPAPPTLPGAFPVAGSPSPFGRATVGPAIRCTVAPDQLLSPSYAVYCNACNGPIENEHFHCGTCNDGDFDLCCRCVDTGCLCAEDRHWLIKRFIKAGVVLNSNTVTLSPKKAIPSVPSAQPAADRATLDHAPTPTPTQAAPEPEVAIRTCNCCVEVFPASKFVECTVCDDYDICVPCLLLDQHGHDPSHALTPAASTTQLSAAAQGLCAPGRDRRHHALCDGCDKTIVGVCHKCLDCPDWDFCAACIANAPFIHPGHRFVPILTPLTPRRARKQHHYGKLCDGPLCQGKTNPRYIVGDRYKCAVCPDTDFCANCEASPINQHNGTHPLVKFKTPVRHVTVSTTHERPDGVIRPHLGDAPTRATSTGAVACGRRPLRRLDTTPARTVVDLTPTDTATPPPSAQARESPGDGPTASADPAAAEDELRALLVGESVAEGTKLPPYHVFRQVWTVENPGPSTWPAGCRVKFVGGDNMRNIDMMHPTTIAALEKSVESDACPLTLGPGAKWHFAVTLKTPTRSGRSVSYWRLTAPNGAKFGHNLWCEVEVTRALSGPRSGPPPARPLIDGTNVWAHDPIPLATHARPAAGELREPRDRLRHLELARARQERERRAPTSAAALATSLDWNRSFVHGWTRGTAIATDASAVDGARSPGPGMDEAVRTELRALLRIVRNHLAAAGREVYMIPGLIGRRARLLEIEEQLHRCVERREVCPPAPTVAGIRAQLVELGALLPGSGRPSVPRTGAPILPPLFPAALPSTLPRADLDADHGMLDRLKWLHTQQLAEHYAADVNRTTAPWHAHAHALANAHAHAHAHAHAFANANTHALTHAHVHAHTHADHLADDLADGPRGDGGPPVAPPAEPVETKTTVDEAVKVESPAASPVETAIESATESKASESAMIFPKLEKESAAVEAAAAVATTATTTTMEAADAATSASASETEDDLISELESLKIEDDESEEGFLTDEEYDILDASDEEGLADAAKAAPK
ncbi:MAG: hypothetical protein M1826_006408 [Phylliscum demangeonii]|nr:MAG: hypothetical protein M1826_006408 [Phylliscum demangeonii]